MDHSARLIQGLSAYVISLLCVSVIADGSARRAPSDELGNEQTASASNGEVIDLNPDREPVITSSGVQTVTSVSVDTTHGIARTLVTRLQPTSLVIDDDGPDAVAFAEGGFEISSFTVASGSPEGVDIVFEMPLDAVITESAGRPTFLIQANLNVIVGAPIPLRTYLSGSATGSSAVFPPGDLFQTSNALFGDFISGTSEPWDGFEIINESFVFDDLRSVMRLTVPVVPGDVLALFGSYNASISPMPSGMPDGSTLPSAGTIDSFNTVEIRIVLPNGISLIGNDPLLENIVVTANDVDEDGIADEVDNCQTVANTDQIDADGDGYGNACDADYNNDCIVNVLDLGLLRSGFFGSDPVLDLDGDGLVNVIDLGLFRNLFFGIPGPGLGEC